MQRRRVCWSGWKASCTPSHCRVPPSGATLPSWLPSSSSSAGAASQSSHSTLLRSSSSLALPYQQLTHPGLPGIRYRGFQPIYLLSFAVSQKSSVPSAPSTSFTSTAGKSLPVKHIVKYQSLKFFLLQERHFPRHSSHNLPLLPHSWSLCKTQSRWCPSYRPGRTPQLHPHGHGHPRLHWLWSWIRRHPEPTGCREHTCQHQVIQNPFGSKHHSFVAGQLWLVSSWHWRCHQLFSCQNWNRSSSLVLALTDCFSFLPGFFFLWSS